MTLREIEQAIADAMFRAIDGDMSADVVDLDSFAAESVGNEPSWRASGTVMIQDDAFGFDVSMSATGAITFRRWGDLDKVLKAREADEQAYQEELAAAAQAEQQRLARNASARVRYNSPENRAKRAAQHAELKRRRASEARQRLRESIALVNAMIKR